MNDTNKWRKYRFMRSSEPVRSHVPETRVMSENDLWAMVTEYGDVIVKPTTGSRGTGVIRIKSLGGDQYEVHYESNRFVVHGKDQAYRKVLDRIGSRNYIVQRRISLAKVNDRPFDIRVVVQRKRLSRNWKVTGDVAKVAGKGYIVTNISRSGGNVMSARRAIEQSSLQSGSGDNYRLDVKKVALLTARKLSRNYPKHRIFGFDMGLDNQGRTWIIEANMNPMLSHFKKLKDQSMYREILAYKKGISKKRDYEGETKKRPKKTFEPSKSIQVTKPIHVTRPIIVTKPILVAKPMESKPLMVTKPILENKPLVVTKPIQLTKPTQSTRPKAAKPIYSIYENLFWQPFKNVPLKKSRPLIYPPAIAGS